MEKLFAALEAKHPGFKVVDVQFTVLNSSEYDSNIDYDTELVKAVANAVECDINLLK